MTKRSLAIFAAVTATFMAGNVQALETSLTAYGTYWSGDDVDGYGAGLRLKKSLMDLISVDARGGYIDFSDADTTVIPLEASLNLGLPFFLSPYVGVGGGYYMVDSSLPGYDDEAGYFGQFGIEFKLFMVGAMAELRYMDLQDSPFDGMSANVGLLLKW